MKYVLAKYLKNPLDVNDSGITFGVIVQSKNFAKLKFSNNVAELKQYDENLNEFIYLGLEHSLEEIMKKNNIVISSPAQENIVIAPTDTKFLEELRKSYQGKQQFSEIKETYGYRDINTALKDLYATFVKI